MNDYLYLLALKSVPAVAGENILTFDTRSIEVRNGIPRFTPDLSYSTGNFSLLRERHSLLQFDSRNGTSDRRDTTLRRTGWQPEFFKDKLILECGCGAGPDTEILRSFGANVVSVDIAGLDVASRNIGSLGRGCFIQADIADLPLRRAAFDIVYCHRVLQHTPNPARTLDHILQFVRPGGAAFVHSYARTAHQMLRWKYALRPITKRMDPQRLYRTIEKAAPYLFKLTNAMYRVRGGRTIAHHLVPFLNYSGAQKFARMSPSTMLEYAIHDTFDALSPSYDQPISARRMKEIAQRWLDAPFEVYEEPSITILRTRP